jgi:hypothetical protein
VENVMTNNEQKNDITELQPEDTKAVVGGVSAIAYGIAAATISMEIAKDPNLAKLAAAVNKPPK